MKTKVNSLAFLLPAFFTIGLSAQELEVASPVETSPSEPTAAITIEESIHDFGVVEEGTIVSQVFTFTNTSDQPLVISDARGSCGCTVPQWPHEPIQPGETASLTVEFDSKGKQGKRNQRVTLTANTSPPQTFLYLTGEVITKENVDTDISDSPAEKPEVVISPDCFAIYPNPTAEVLKLEMEENTYGQPALITIYSKSGQLMARREIKAIDGPIEFSVGHYPAGTYIANVKIGDREPQARCFVVVD